MFILIRRLILAALVLLFGTAASAQVINGCVKNKNGALRIVADPTDCTSRETPISWNVQGPQGEPGVDGADGAPGADGSDAEVLHVFDAMGTDVGLLLNWEVRKVDVFIPDLDLTVRLSVLDASLDTNAPAFISALFYTTPDCSGQAYADSYDSIPLLARFHAGLAIWVVVEAGRPIEIIQNQSAIGANGLCSVGGSQMFATPVAFLEPGLLDYLDDLVPPLYVDLAPEPAP
jgi:hypothetical protein